MPRPKWPAEIAPLLTQINGAFARRGKAIRHDAKSFEIRREFESTDEGAVQRLNVDYRALDRTQIRLSVWEDGELWLGVHRPQKRGWAFAYRRHGDLSSVEAAEVVRRFEKTVSAAHSASGLESERAIDSIWNELLASKR